MTPVAQFSEPTFIGLAFLGALFYVLAIFVLKLGSSWPFLMVMIPVALANGLGAWFEGMALRDARVGEVFFLILAFEVLILAVVSITVFAERYGVREIAGIMLIVAGICLTRAGSGADASEATRVAGPQPVGAILTPGVVQ